MFWFPEQALEFFSITHSCFLSHSGEREMCGSGSQRKVWLQPMTEQLLLRHCALCHEEDKVVNKVSTSVVVCNLIGVITKGPHEAAYELRLINSPFLRLSEQTFTPQPHPPPPPSTHSSLTEPQICFEPHPFLTVYQEASGGLVGNEESGKGRQ